MFLSVHCSFKGRVSFKCEGAIIPKLLEYSVGKILLIIIMFTFTLRAELILSAKVHLKKDQQEKILVSGDGFRKLLVMRWTLYINDGLVYLQTFNKEVSHYVLYKDRRNHSVRIELMSRSAMYGAVPYILISFKDFDYEKNEAVFELYLSDKDEKVSLKYLSKKEE